MNDAITNSLAPVGEGTGDSSLSGANSPALVEHVSEGGDSFSLIHNPRAHVCPACNAGYVHKPDNCHTCDYPLWFDSKREASNIVWEAS